MDQKRKLARKTTWPDQQPKLVLSHIWPELSPNPQWWDDWWALLTSLSLGLPPGQTELHHIHIETDLYLKIFVFHTTCFNTVCTEELYISRSYMQQVLTTWKALCTHLYCVCSGFYQWLHWYANAVQGSTTGSANGTTGTNIVEYCLPILQTP